MSNPQINAWYDYAMAHGALAEKSSVRGGGFLMFYAGTRRCFATQ